MIIYVTLLICFTALLCTALVTGAWQKIRIAQIEVLKLNAQATALAAAQGMAQRN